MIKKVVLINLFFINSFAIDIGINTTGILPATDYNFIADVNLTSDVDVTMGIVTTTSNSQGTLSLGHNITTSSIGSASEYIKVLDITANTTTLGADIYATTTNISSGAVLEIQTFDLFGAVNNDGTLNINTNATVNGNVTNNGNLWLRTGSSINGDITGTGSIYVSDDFTSTGVLEANTLSVLKNVTLNLDAAPSTISSVTLLYGNNSKIESNKDTDLGSFYMQIDASDYYGFGINSINRVVEVTGGADLTVSNITNNNDTALVYFTTSSVAQALANDVIDVVMNYQSSSYLDLVDNNKNTYDAAGVAIYSERVIFDTMNAMTKPQIKDAIETMNSRPEGIAFSAVTLSATNLNSVSKHLENSRAKVTSIGISSGNGFIKNNVWGDINVMNSKMENDQYNGYETAANSMVIGYDRNINKDNDIFGVAVAVSKSDTKSLNSLSSVNTNTESLQGVMYASQNYYKYFLEEMLSFSYNKNIKDREIQIGSINRVANSNFDSKLVASKFTIGYPKNLFGFYVVPKASVQYSYLVTDFYKESGAGGLNLSVDTNDYTSLISEIGFSASKVLYLNRNLFIPTINLSYIKNFGDNEVSTLSTFEAGGSAFETNAGSLNEDILNYGLGLRYISKDRMSEFDLNYDVSDGSKYNDSVSSLSARFKF